MNNGTDFLVFVHEIHHQQLGSPDQSWKKPPRHGRFLHWWVGEICLCSALVKPLLIALSPIYFCIIGGSRFWHMLCIFGYDEIFPPFWFFALVFLEFMEGNRHTPIFLFYTKAREGCRGTTMRWMPRALVAPMIASLDVGNPCPLHMPCVWVPRVWDQSEGRGCTKSEPKI